MTPKRRTEPPPKGAICVQAGLKGVLGFSCAPRPGAIHFYACRPMIEPERQNTSPLLDALDALYDKVSADPMQPLTMLAEEAVLHWTRVLDGQDAVAPRLSVSGYAPEAFHIGMEHRSNHRLDDCALIKGLEAFETETRGRLDGMLEALESYFGGSGYRGSSDQCDRMMLELSRLSRFLNAWLAAAERHALRNPAPLEIKAEAPGGIFHFHPDETVLIQARRRLAVLEPFLNTAIVSWEENHLEPFERALNDLHGVLGLSPDEIYKFLPLPGFPLRRRRLPRQKISVFEPDQRPLRSRSVLRVRFQQLRERLLKGAVAEPGTMKDLTVDVGHFNTMVDTNLFMLGGAPGFHGRARPGVRIIRGRARNHPFLLDPRGFFKKAVLFHNGTYSSGGGALDQMFLQLRQLERLCRFMRWGDWTRPLRGPIDRGIIAWEENRDEGFTARLLEVAGLVREIQAQ